MCREFDGACLFFPRLPKDSVRLRANAVGIIGMLSSVRTGWSDPEAQPQDQGSQEQCDG